MPSSKRKTRIPVKCRMMIKRNKLIVLPPSGNRLPNKRRRG
jgi:hypothetical protein